MLARNLFALQEDNPVQLLCLLKDGQKMSIDRELLVKQCTAFERLLQSEMKDKVEAMEERTLSLPECPIEVFRRVRVLLYTNQIPLDEKLQQENLILWGKVASFCDVHLWNKGRDLVVFEFRRFLEKPQTVVADFVTLVYEHRFECPDFWVVMKEKSRNEMMRHLYVKSYECADELLECHDTLDPGQGTIYHGGKAHVCCQHSLPLFSFSAGTLKRKKPSSRHWPTGLSACLDWKENITYGNKQLCWSFAMQLLKTEDDKQQFFQSLPTLDIPATFFKNLCCAHKMNLTPQEIEACAIIRHSNVKRRMDSRAATRADKIYRSLDVGAKVELFEEFLTH